MADHHAGGALGAHQPGERGAHVTDEPRVDLFTDHTANVVSLDHRVHEFGRAGDCHGTYPSVPARGAGTVPAGRPDFRLPRGWRAAIRRVADAPGDPGAQSVSAFRPVGGLCVLGREVSGTARGRASRRSVVAESMWGVAGRWRSGVRQEVGVRRLGSANARRRAGISAGGGGQGGIRGGSVGRIGQDP